MPPSRRNPYRGRSGPAHLTPDPVGRGADLPTSVRRRPPAILANDPRQAPQLPFCATTETPDPSKGAPPPRHEEPNDLLPGPRPLPPARAARGRRTDPRGTSASQPRRAAATRRHGWARPPEAAPPGLPREQSEARRLWRLPSPGARHGVRRGGARSPHSSNADRPPTGANETSPTNRRDRCHGRRRSEEAAACIHLRSCGTPRTTRLDRGPGVPAERAITRAAVAGAGPRSHPPPDPTPDASSRGRAGAAVSPVGSVDSRGGGGSPTGRMNERLRARRVHAGGAEAARGRTRRSTTARAARTREQGRRPSAHDSPNRSRTRPRPNQRLAACAGAHPDRRRLPVSRTRELLGASRPSDPPSVVAFTGPPAPDWAYIRPVLPNPDPRERTSARDEAARVAACALPCQRPVPASPNRPPRLTPQRPAAAPLRLRPTPAATRAGPPPAAPVAAARGHAASPRTDLHRALALPGSTTRHELQASELSPPEHPQPDGSVVAQCPEGALRPPQSHQRGKF
ncbi:unnamed protein product [Dicrocoelium dendriticum]|nr:unnamed protein product [Dicrocoelium dendriticum]